MEQLTCCARETLNKYLLGAKGVHNSGFYADRNVRATFNRSFPRRFPASDQVAKPIPRPQLQKERIGGEGGHIATASSSGRT